MKRLPPAIGLALAFLSGCCSAELIELQAPDPDDRRAALACLSEQVEDEPSLRAPLTSAALALKEPSVEADPAVRGAALRSLVRLEARGSTASVRSSLRAEPEPLVRRAAIELLGAFAKSDAAGASLAVLRRHLKSDEDRDVRLAAARELGAWGDTSEETTQALIGALDDYDHSVRHNARRTLAKLYESDQGLSPAAWRRWLDLQRAEAEAPLEDGPPLPEGPEELPPPEPERIAEPEDYDFPEQDPFQTPTPDGASEPAPPGEGPPPPQGAEGEPAPPSEGPPPPVGPERTPSGPPPPPGPEGGSQ